MGQKLQAVAEAGQEKEPDNKPSEQVSIADLPTERLKALAYDRLAIIERAKAELQALNQEIQRRPS